jgi:MFS family permease
LTDPLYAASSLGVVVLSLIVGPLNRRFRFATVIVLALSLYGGGTAVFGLLSSYSVALGVMGIVGGATVLYNASSASLRQRIVPKELMGRVWSVALTGGWCMIPLASIFHAAESSA